MEKSILDNSLFELLENKNKEQDTEVLKRSLQKTFGKIVNKWNVKQERSNDNILSKCFSITGVNSYEVTIPDFKGVAAWEDNLVELENNKKYFNRAKLRSKRVVSKVVYSKLFSILGPTKPFNEYMESRVVKTIEDEIVRTMLSDKEGNDSKPSGIFNGLVVENISYMSDLVSLQSSVDKQEGKNTWIISPTAKEKIYTMSNNYNIFDNDTFLNSPVIFDNRMQDGFIAYLDLDRLNYVQWDNSFTTFLDTKSYVGSDLNALLIDANVNWMYNAQGNNKADLIKVGKFA